MTTTHKDKLDQAGKTLVEKSKTATTWWKKLLLWLSGVIILGASALYLSSCSLAEKYDVDYDHDSGSVTISPKPVDPVK